MTRIAIISMINLYLLPYANTYINLLLEQNCDIDLIYWDRSVDDPQIPSEHLKVVKYKKLIPVNASKFKKIRCYFESAQHIRDQIKLNQYDGLVFLQTQPAILCVDILLSKYRKSFIIDIRDYSFENITFYKMLEKRLIANSYSTVISSPGYIKFLPMGKYILAHNYTEVPKESKKTERTLHFPLSISFIGAIRFLDINKKIIQIFGNDERFFLNFFGTGSSILRQFCEKIKVYNCNFAETFPPEQTLGFYDETDLINNIYGNNTPLLDYALSNKLYYSAQLYIPILVCPNTYMAELVTKYKIGYVFSFEKQNIKDELIVFYETINWADFKMNCDLFIEQVKKDNYLFYKNVRDFSQSISDIGEHTND